MSRLAIAIAALVGPNAAAVAEPAGNPVLARAISSEPSAAVVRFVADNSEGSVYDALQRPELAAMALAEVATVHCGSLQDGYEEATRRANPDLTIPAGAPLGALAYQVRWPACLHAVTARDLTYTVRRDDTLTGIMGKFTGSGLFSRSALNKFFGPSRIKVAAARSLAPGTTIVVPLSTTATLIQPKGLGAAEFASRLNDIGGGNVSVNADAQAAGSIVGPVRFRDPSAPIGAVQGTFEPCDGDDSNSRYPFDAAEVAGTYSWMRGQIASSVSRVTVVVVDNGFFGVPCDPTGCPVMDGDRVASSPRFPRKLFDTVTFDPRTGFGPVLSGRQTSPLNYWNRKTDGAYFKPSDVDAETGHGTHVAGLVLGGPQFADRRELFDGALGKSWMTLVIANLAGGRSVLLPGTDRDLADMLSPVDGNKIVNMSVAFTARAGTPTGGTIRDAIVKDATSLFVVAAGNDGGSLDDDALDLYPANLGGRDGNVMTVGSVDAPVNGISRLSKFSNRSRNYVDIAAPGCRISSWLDADQAPARVSGTSQATPLVTFGAALLNSLWQTTPRKLKDRFIYSGDLLDDPSDRASVRSQSRLNIGKALTYTYDRVVYTRDGIRRTLLGALTPVAGLRCADGASVEAANVRALKRLPEGGVLMFRNRNDGSLAICPGPFEGALTVDFAPAFEIRDGAVGPVGDAVGPITFDEVDEIVRQR